MNNKIASPQQLQVELQRIRDYVTESQPSRAKLARELTELAERVAGGSSMDPQSAEKEMNNVLEVYLNLLKRVQDIFASSSSFDAHPSNIKQTRESLTEVIKLLKNGRHQMNNAAFALQTLVQSLGPEYQNWRH
jgi:uncharacterized protein YukE